MADNPTFLNRWSRRKHEAARATQTPAEPAPAPPELPVATPAAAAAPAVQATAMPAEPPLPPADALADVSLPEQLVLAKSRSSAVSRPGPDMSKEAIFVSSPEGCLGRPARASPN